MMNRKLIYTNRGFLRMRHTSPAKRTRRRCCTPRHSAARRRSLTRRAESSSSALWRVAVANSAASVHCA
jgi:hypothetical protein